MIVHSNDLPVSVSTIYRYIDKNKIDVKKIDLPYAATYKKRKKKTKNTLILIVK